MATDSILRPGELKDILLREIASADLTTADVSEVGHRARGEGRHRPHLRPPVGDGERDARVHRARRPARRWPAWCSTWKRTTSAPPSWATTSSSRKATRSAAPAACSRCRPARRCSGRVVDALGRPVDGRGPIQTTHTRAGRDGGAGHHRPPAGEGAAADRHQGHRRDDPDRPRPARADHRRPRHRQDRHRGRHDHQSEGHRRHLRLRRHRPEALDGRHGGGEAAQTRARWSTPSSSSPRASDPAPLQYIAPVHRLRAWPSTSCTRRASRRSACTTTSPSRPPRTASSRSFSAARRAARRIPGDVFYLHSRLLERAAKISEDAEAIEVRPAHQEAGRLAHRAADHRDPGRRRLGVHPDQRHLDHRRPDLPRRPTCSTPTCAPRWTPASA